MYTNMSDLVFATGNSHKVQEAAALLEGAFRIISMAELGCQEELPEDQPTLEGNALQKARYLHQYYKVDCFSEDTGLEVDALDGAPGVYSARYAGPGRSAEDNMALLLERLQGQAHRHARFRTVIALILEGQEYLFEGVAQGTIAHEKRGGQGFGYDPVFIPEGCDRSFAEMSAAEKNAISHRAKAVAKLKAFLLEKARR
jgi:XTP/dITP diphosphohydrolase